MKKRIVSLLLAVVMIASMLPLGALPVSAADAVISFLNWNETEKKLVSASVTDYTPVTSKTETLNSGWYIVNADAVVSNRITVSGDVHLILCDGAKLTANKGISVKNGDSLTIYGQENGTGALIATTDESFYSGIGGDNGVVDGYVTYNGNSGNITVNGGKIRAQGGFASAGIGGGLYGVCGPVTVNGGDVTAVGGFKCAGITNGSGAAVGTNLAISDNMLIFAGNAENTMEVLSIDDYKQNINIVEEGDNDQKYVRICDCRHKGKAATCTDPGYDTYYEYDGKYYQDSALTQEILDIDAWLAPDGGGYIQPNGHSFVGGECTVCGEKEDFGKYVIRRWNDTTKKVEESEMDIPTDAEKITSCDHGLTLSPGKWYIVSGDVTVSGRITVAGTPDDPTSIILMGGCTLNAKLGISVAVHDALHIYGQSGDTGTLTATGGGNAAGIGGARGNVGGNAGNGGNITVYGGIVNATGDSGAAGIGGGFQGNGGTVTVYGGTVTATGSSGGAGIGGGSQGNGGTVTVYGGTVTAVAGTGSGGDAQAIGKGSGGSTSGSLELGASVGIKAGSSATDAQAVPEYTGEPYAQIHFHSFVNGKCTVCGETDSRYIVRSWNETTKKVEETEMDIPKDVIEITSSDSELTLSAGKWYIVSGNVTVSERITVEGTPDDPTSIILMDGYTLNAAKGITVAVENALHIYGQSGDTGTLTATGSGNTAGIGGVGAGNGGTVTVYGGTVNATGGDGAAGIGGGFQANGDTVTVYGGKVTAQGGFLAAGIGGGMGGGMGGDGGTVTIYGGIVNATGGFEGAGIGGGSQGSGGAVTISGGTVTATAGGGNAQAIGKGSDEGSSGSLELGASAVVIAGSSATDAKAVPKYTGQDYAQIHFHTAETIKSISGTQHECVVCGVQEHTWSITMVKHTCSACGFSEAHAYDENGECTVCGSLKPQISNKYVDCHWVAAREQWESEEKAIPSDAKTLAEDTATLSSGWYVVPEDVTVSERVTVSGDVHLILCDNATLTADKGIGVPADNSLTIYGQTYGTGTLTAAANDGCAGIGGDSGAGDSGSIMITGGTVTAQGGANAAGIGGGQGGVCGLVTVVGGTVTAIGGQNCAGIANGSGAARTSALEIGGMLLYAGASADSMQEFGQAEYKEELQYSGGDALKYVRIFFPEHAEKAATCIGPGHAAYYEDTAGKYYKDKAHSQEITDIGVWLGVGGEGCKAPTGIHEWRSVGTAQHRCKHCGAVEAHAFSGGECTVCGTVEHYGKYIARSWNAQSNEVDEAEIAVPENAIELTADTMELAGGWYIVAHNVEFSERPVITGTPENPTNIILMDGCTLTAKDGIEVAEQNALSIFGQSLGTGAVNATSARGPSKAGIGGSNDGNGGTVTIHGGTVTAISSGPSVAAGGAGIGGGDGGDGGTVTIYGGTVTATGATSSGHCGAGIGGGHGGGHGGTVTIYGGTVTANGGSNSSGSGSAGIGGGNDGNGGKFEMFGGVVRATGGSSGDKDGGAGIGASGIGDNCGTIAIHGGMVTAAGGSGRGDRNGVAGAGIGASAGRGTITITGGTVTATGGAAATTDGIGGMGIGAVGGDITISGGTVAAIGTENGAGIDSRTVTITGGTVTATGDGDGMGIDSTVTITGGAVTATGGSGDEAKGINGSLTLADSVHIKAGHSATDAQAVTEYNGERYALIHYHTGETFVGISDAQHICLFCGALEDHDFVDGKCACGRKENDADANYFYLKNIGAANATITWETAAAGKLEYRVNDGTFAEFPGSVTLAPGDKCYFWGINGHSSDDRLTCQTENASIAAGGDVGTLLNAVGNMQAYPEYALCNLFLNFEALTDISDLTLCRADTVLGKYCFAGMFGGCTGLTAVPEGLLPVTTLAEGCYRVMFNNCENLQNAPTLPATQLCKECYMSMFNGCDRLTSIRVAFTQWGTDADQATYLFLPEFVYGTLLLYCPTALDIDARGYNAIQSTLSFAVMKPVSVQLFAAGGTGGTTSVMATYGNPLPAITVPTRAGYTFEGYYDFNGVKYYNADGTGAKAWDKTETMTVLAAIWSAASAHEHTFEDHYTYNETHHWRAATCGHTVVDGFGAHSFTTETKDGTTTYTCDCGYQKIEYSGTEGEITQDGVKYTGISLTLGSDIYMNFYMELPEAAAASGTMAFTIGGRTVQAAAEPVDGEYRFVCPLTALEMAETVTAKFTYNGKTYTKSFSVERYIDYILNEKDANGQPYSDDMKTLAMKIANYGHYVQLYLESIHTNVTIGGDGYAPMKKFAECDIDFASARAALLALDNFVTPAPTENYELYGRTVYFDSATSLNYYVTVKTGGALTAEAVTCKDKAGKARTVEVKPYKDNVYIVSVKDITATELGDTFTVTLNDGFTIRGTVLDYCGAVFHTHYNADESQIAAKDWLALHAMAAFYEYHTAAVNYFDPATTCTVSFNMMGHGEQISSQKVKKGGRATEPDDPTADGYEFQGWFGNEACTEIWYFDTQITGDTTIYAKWVDQLTAARENAKVELRRKADAVRSDVVLSVWLDEDRKYDHIAALDSEVAAAKDAIDAAGTVDDVYAAEAAAEAEIDTLKAAAQAEDEAAQAMYKADAKEQINSYAAEKEATIQDMSWLTDAEKCDYIGRISDIVATQKANITAAESKTAIGTAVKAAEAAIDAVIAEAGKTYTVSFDMMGHGSQVSSQKVKDCGQVTKPTDPTADGFRFDGWYKDQNCTVKWNFDTDTVTEDTTLYAGWEAYNATYVVTLWGVDGNGTATFGPATGNNAGCLEHACGRDHCIHTDTWEEIRKNISEGHGEDYYDDCIKEGCTKNIPLALNDTIFSGYSLKNPASVLRTSIKSSYREYNDSDSSDDCESANWATSRIRATLNGYNNEYAPFTCSIYANPETGNSCLTKDTCLFSCFPAELQALIVPRTYEVPTSWSTSEPTAYKINTRLSVTDKLWLPSAVEVFGTSLSDEYKDYGEPFPSRIGKSTSDNKAYDEQGSASEWMLRSPYRSKTYAAAKVKADGGCISTRVSATTAGLAPCFCIGSQASFPRHDTLEAYSWAELRTVSDAISDGTIPEKELDRFKGFAQSAATKKVKLNCQEDDYLYVRIIGLNHDTRTDGQGNAGITFMAVNSINQGYYSGDRGDSSSTYAAGWAVSPLRDKMQQDGEIFNLLPTELTDQLRSVTKRCRIGWKDTSVFDPTLQTSNDKLFLLSGTELGTDRFGSDEGSKYEYIDCAPLYPSSWIGFSGVLFQGANYKGYEFIKEHIGEYSEFFTVLVGALHEAGGLVNCDRRNTLLRSVDTYYYKECGSIGYDGTVDTQTVNSSACVAPCFCI